MAEEPRLICVRTCQGLDVAQIYKSKLEALEIPVLLRYESAGLVYGITVDGLGQVRVMVPEPYAAEAKALLADFTDDELAENSIDEEPISDLTSDEIAGNTPDEEPLPGDSADR
jgi:hypothetical protein